MKQRKLNKRKGFTLVELLVVIAILAVLATVSVVGYTSFTKKAKVSNDVSLTTQMNTILQANEVTDGKNTTPHEAVEELVAGGLDVTKLTPTANGYSYVYDLDANRMVLVDEDMNVVSPDKSTFANKLNVFAFVEKESDLEEAKYAGYSFYLKNNFESDDDVTVKTGVDTGNNNISKLTYTNTKATVGQEVMIRTNGGTLEVNAPLDTVEHYAKADKVVITAVAGNSYHENGEILGEVKVIKGNVVVEKDATANSVVIAGAEAKATIESGSQVESVVATDKTYYTKVTNNNSSTKIDENITVNLIENSPFSGGDGQEKTPFIIANEENFKALTKYTNDNKSSNVYVKLVSDIEMNLTVTIDDDGLVPQVSLYSNVNLDMNGKTIKPSEKSINDDFGNASPVLMSVISGKLTITGNGTIDCECGNNQVYGINIYGGSVVIENGNFYGALSAVQVQIGTLEIKGGFFDLASTCKSVVPQYSKYVVNAIDSSYKEGTATVSISGGSFVKFDPSANPEGEGTTYVAEGYKVVSTEIGQEQVYKVVAE